MGLLRFFGLNSLFGLLVHRRTLVYDAYQVFNATRSYRRNSVSTVLLIDGYNVISPIAPPGNFRPTRAEAMKGSPKSWLMIEREKFLDQLAQTLDEPIKARTCVVFDAKNSPPNQPHSLVKNGITVRFAVDHPEADDLLEEMITQHHHPKHLTVVSSDHRIQAAARRRRAKFFDSEPWYDALLDGSVQLGWKPKKRSGTKPFADQPNAQTAPHLEMDVDVDISDEELQRYLDGQTDH